MVHVKKLLAVLLCIGFICGMGVSIVGCDSPKPAAKELHDLLATECFRLSEESPHDDLAFDTDWGFDVSAIDRPALLLHGGDDRFVPVSHGRWLAARIPGVEARIDPADGHLTLLERRMREVNEWLLARS